MKDKHTPEPWKLRGNAVGIIDKSDTQSYGMMLSIACVDKYDFKDEWEANARRIVTCVNYCKGLETLDMVNATESGNGAAETIRTLTEQRDELLAALENAHEFISNGIEFGFIKMPDELDDPAHKTLPMINNAIAKAKGQ